MTADRRGPDRYTTVARWTPGALVALPISITALIALPTLDALTSKIFAAAVAAGLPIIVSQLVRNAGRRAQAQLYESWGGPPTTIMLRSRLSSDDVVAERLRRRLREAVGEFPAIPDAESADGAGDDVYDAITGVLRSRTRQQDLFPTVYDELVHYGFWRNCLGVRSIALGLAAFATVISGVMAGLTGSGSMAGSERAWIAAAVIDLLITTAWWCLRPTRVRTAGDRYAEALLGAVENLPLSESGASK
jgi:hypothetical protein